MIQNLAHPKLHWATATFAVLALVSAVACAGKTKTDQTKANASTSQGTSNASAGGFVEVSADCQSRWSQMNTNLDGFLATNAENWSQWQTLLPNSKQVNRTCPEYGETIAKMTANREKIWTSLRKNEAIYLDVLAKLQASAAGDLSQWVCEDLGRSITKNPENFLKAVDSNREYITELSCIVNGGTDFVDAGAKSKRQNFSKRRSAIQSVNNPQLASVKSEILQVLRN